MTTKADLSRFQALERIGCIACHMQDRWTASDVHHVLSGGKRKGHQYTIPLCPWHHRGVTSAGYSRKDMHDIAGPSLALNPKAFHGEFGDDEGLLTLTNQLIGAR
jgi:hypothetical protein